MSDDRVRGLKKLPAHLDIVYDLTADAIISINSAQKILFFNKGAERIFGYQQEEILGKSLLQLLPERYRHLHADQVNSFQSSDLQSKLMAERSEIFGLRKDGSEFPAETSISKVETADGLVFVAVLRDVTDRKEHDRKIENALHEKELLLQEVHHRVKNNLQIISSLLSLQAEQRDSEGEAAVLLEAQNRVKSIALIHERLYRSGDFANIRLFEYLTELVDSLLISFAGNEHIEFDILESDSVVALDQAMPVGLLVNELITNALKHAFPLKRKGKIELSFNSENNNFCIEVVDNGVGLPKDFDLLNSNTLGMQLVTNLAAQLEGQIEFLKQKEGFGVRVSFPSSVQGGNNDS